MDARIETSSEKKVIGKRTIMSVTTSQKNIELWKSFGPRKKEITDSIDFGLRSIVIYPAGYFDKFDPDAKFEKWAAVEVKSLDNVPAGMEALTIKSGLYAVFLYKGDPRQAFETFKYIFTEWIPQSAYIVDDRPHFAVMGERYINNDPNSEEEFWVPVRKKE